MTEADQKLEDDVLRRMLATKPQPHKSQSKDTDRDIQAKVTRPKNERVTPCD